MAIEAKSRGDRITELGVKGLRTLADVRLKLGPLTTIIGASGSGKSSLAEACVLLYSVAHDSFARGVLGLHGGFSTLLRHGANTIELSARIEGNGVPLEYSIVIGREPTGALFIQSESLETEEEEGTAGKRAPVFTRSLGTAKLWSFEDRPPDTMRVQVDAPFFAGIGNQPTTIVGRARAALLAIQVQIGFPSAPLWAAQQLGATKSLRETVVVQPADRLDFGGLNLPNAFNALRNESNEHWNETMEYVRLGLGEGFENVVIQFDPGGGRASLALRWSDQQVQPAWVLSDGQLAYLAFVAMFRLQSKASLFVFDEPDAHLHPALIQRVMGFFDQMSERTNVLLCTHSDRLLDALPDPAQSTVLFELNQERATVASRPTAPQLGEWLERYSGIGTLRAEGYEALVFADGKREEAAAKENEQ